MVKTKGIEYLGIEVPKTPDEVNFEILGLRTAIEKANLKIHELEQAIILAKLVTEKYDE